MRGSHPLSIDGIWEHLTRSVPEDLEFQNERQRNGSRLAMTQVFGLIYGLPLRYKSVLAFGFRIGLRQIYPASDASVDAGSDGIRSQEPRYLLGVGTPVQAIRLIPRRSDLLPSASRSGNPGE